MSIYVYDYASPLGTLAIASDGQNVTGLWIEGQKYQGPTLPETYERKRVPPIAQTERWLDTYFAGKNPAMTLPLMPAGSDFRQSVWRALLRVLYGETTTYGSLAARIAGKERNVLAMARAVGGAVGHNPISILIPCHRVVGANGKLTGYAGGLERKRWLLELEQGARRPAL
ncbi:MAG: methylated-DNA--[protein]-cysteine S-methyltransferase [Planctomycetota bacterium]|jgi:methylated-DNA-[protein]-cysteine S-methyltransferase|nr:methylated-DNA--[protein]-cysteine S-methyltransferase [Planctomycetota bacterium]